MDEVTYGFAEHVFDPPIDDPQVLGEEIDSLRRDYGRVDRYLLVEEAASPDSPIHGWFEWNDDTAAYEYRLKQASELLRAVVITKIGDQSVAPVRANVRISRKVGDEPAEVTYESVLDPEVRQVQLQRLRRDLFAMRRRLAAFVEFEDVVEAIDSLQATAA
jgi:hypothetical protein